MEYIAKSYIGGKITPGEIVQEDVFPEEVLESLIRRGALAAVSAPLPAAREEDPETAEPARAEAEPEEETEAEEQPEDIMEIDAAEALVTEPAKKRKTGGGRKGGKKE